MRASNGYVSCWQGRGIEVVLHEWASLAVDCSCFWTRMAERDTWHTRQDCDSCKDVSNDMGLRCDT
jgi:hypothetical protein